MPKPRKTKKNPSDNSGKKSSAELLAEWDRVRGTRNFSKVCKYLCDVRKISKEAVNKCIEAGILASYDIALSVPILNEFYYDGTDPHTLVFRFDNLDGEITAIEHISTTGKPIFIGSKGPTKKKFEAGSRAGEGFVQTGIPVKDAYLFILVEAAINCLSGVDCYPDACWLALGGSTMTAKLKQLKKILRGKDAKIICFFDHDEAGEKAVQQSVKALSREVHTVVYPDGTPDGYDVNDLLKAGQRQAVVAMIENAEPVKVKKPEPQEEEKKTQSQILLEEAQACDFFHTTDSKVYARIDAGDHFETHNVKSKTFRLWLSHRFYLREEKAPSSQSMTDALNVIAGIGLFECPERELFLRVAEKDGCIYIDLCDDKWQAVKISADGWEIVDNPPVYFRRAKGMKAMVVPLKNGDINDLRRFLNLSNDTDFRLIVAYLVQCFNASGPYPILAFDGEQGCSKSTTSRMIREIADPSDVPLRTIPRTERDLAINAENSCVLALDNLSSMQPWLSDALCRISTGGGFGTRELYEGREEDLFAFMRPILINGIGNMVRRHDLADRTIFTTLPHIPEADRQPEKDLMADFQKAIPAILGGLFDAVSMGLKNRDKVQLDRLPRMADFALWIQACEPALPWEPGGFMEVYAENREKIIESALSSDAVGSAVQQFMESMTAAEWNGTSSELLDALEQVVDERTKNNKYWPKDAPRLGLRLKRSASFLRQVGIEIELPDRGKKDRRTTIKRISVGASKVPVGASKVPVKKHNDSAKVPVGASGASKKQYFLYNSTQHLEESQENEGDNGKQGLSSGCMGADREGAQITGTTGTTGTDRKWTPLFGGEL